MKILELTNYSAGICGVWTRVREESTRLANLGHEVLVLSSNLEKGTDNEVKKEESLEKIKIKRFTAKKLGGESFMHWFGQEAEKEALVFKPDVIIAHSYRHPHTSKAVKIAKKTNSKLFLVTHAPFVKDGNTRSTIAKLAVYLYDLLLGPAILRKYDKVITITKWEHPYLRHLGVKQDKIVYIPNGIPEQFFSKKKSKETDKILFLGRISPIKDIETLLRAMALIKNKDLSLEIVGPAEKEYLEQLMELKKQLNLGNKVSFSPPIYDLNKKIIKLDSASIFVLPSKREAMPQALIEAMARERLVISSANPGSNEIIDNGKNGLLFEVGNPKDLANKIDLASNNKNIVMRKNARSTVEKFNWINLVDKLEKVVSQ